ncbi:MAG TPA: FkbM family methyltransferase [Allosphingosinicella sp.]|nr:FkbM family methyltransferase [Allosphingosinicella sp.]
MDPVEPLLDACRRLGEDEAARARILAALLDYENRDGRRFTNVRDEVTGPLVDALHASAGILRKPLGNGLVLEFRYSSKIARDFVMSLPETPDHVWEPQTTRLLLHLARDGGDAIVGGAYFGDQAVALAHALRGRFSCHAFEPDSAQAEMLARNAALNRLGNLRVDRRALWSEAGTTLGLVGSDAYGRTMAGAGGIPTTTIDAYAAEAGIGRIGLIMLDLEGSELDVLRGAEAVLRRDAPAIVFEIHASYVDWSRGLAETEIVRFLAGHGYTIRAIRDFQSNVAMAGRPIELVPLDGAWLEGPPHGFNLVAVRDPERLEGDPFRLVHGVSPKLLFHRDPALHHPIGGL